jgi:hypothetical protein
MCLGVLTADEHAAAVADGKWGERAEQARGWAVMNTQRNAADERSHPCPAGRYCGPRGAAGILPYAWPATARRGSLVAQAEIVRSLGASVRLAYEVADTVGRPERRSPMTAGDTQIPPGYALVRLTDLAALLAARAARPPETTGATATCAAAWDGLAAATGMLTGELGSHQVNRADLAGGAPAEAVIGALVTVGAGLLKVHQPDSAAALLQYLGLVAASRSTGPDGEPL